MALPRIVARRPLASAPPDPAPPPAPLPQIIARRPLGESATIGLDASALRPVASHVAGVPVPDAGLSPSPDALALRPPAPRQDIELQAEAAPMQGPMPMARIGPPLPTPQPARPTIASALVPGRTPEPRPASNLGARGGSLADLARQTRGQLPQTDYYAEATAPMPPDAAVTLAERAGDVAISGVKGAIALPEAFVGLGDLVSKGHVGKFLEEQFGYRPAEAKAILDTYYSQRQQEGFAAVREADGLVAKAAAALTNPSVIVQSVVESGPSMIGAAGLARGAIRVIPKVAPLAGALGEGAFSAGSAAAQARAESETGLITGRQAGFAAAAGAGTSVFGALGQQVAQRLGIADVDTLLAGAATSPEARRGLVREVVTGAVQEGVVEELPQSVQEQVFANLSAGRDPWEGVDDAAVMGTLAGAVMGGGGQVGSRLRPKTADVVRDGVGGDAARVVADEITDRAMRDDAKDVPRGTPPPVDEGPAVAVPPPVPPPSGPAGEAQAVAAGPTSAVLPPEFTPVGEEPVATGSNGVATGSNTDALIDRVLDKSATGQTLGSPGLQESFAQRQALEEARPDEPTDVVAGAQEAIAVAKTGANGPIRRLQAVPEQPELGVRYEMPARALKAAPGTLQYRGVVNTEGVEAERAITTPYDPLKGGVLAVWQDPKDGETYVVNGHHRLSAAKRDDATIAIVYIPAATAKEARAFGALINLQEDNTNLRDAVQFMVDTNLKVEGLEAAGISPRAKVSRQAAAIASLEPHVRRRWEEGDLPDDIAATIGAAKLDVDQQEAAANFYKDQYARGHAPNQAVMARALDRIKDSPVVEEDDDGQPDIFGNKKTKNVFAERMDLEVYILQELGKDKSRLRAAIREKERLARANTVVDVDAAKAIADESARAQTVINRLMRATGPISAILKQAASELAEGGNREAIRARVLADVTAAAEVELGRAPAPDPSRSGEGRGDDSGTLPGLVPERPPAEPAAEGQPPTEPVAPRKYSSTQVNLPPETGASIRALAATIPDADLAEDGREAEPHITVQYGIESDDVAPLREALAGIGPITITFGKTSLFENEEADVVKVDIESPDLERVRAAIRKVVDAPGDTHPKYIPHATVAYVKPGKGKAYAGRDDLAGQTATIDRLVFSTRDEQTIEIQLGDVPVSETPPPPNKRSPKDILRDFLPEVGLKASLDFADIWNRLFDREQRRLKRTPKRGEMRAVVERFMVEQRKRYAEAMAEQEQPTAAETTADAPKIILSRLAGTWTDVKAWAQAFGGSQDADEKGVTLKALAEAMFTPEEMADRDVQVVIGGEPGDGALDQSDLLDTGEIQYRDGTEEGRLEAVAGANQEATGVSRPQEGRGLAASVESAGESGVGRTDSAADRGRRLEAASAWLAALARDESPESADAAYQRARQSVEETNRPEGVLDRSDRGRTQVRASRRDGGDSRSDASDLGARTPQERGRLGQPSREPRTPLGVGPREGAPRREDAGRAEGGSGSRRVVREARPGSLESQVLSLRRMSDERERAHGARTLLEMLRQSPVGSEEARQVADAVAHAVRQPIVVGVQPRLPDDVGAVREIENPTPQEPLPESAFTLRAQDAAPDTRRPEQSALFDLGEAPKAKKAAPGQSVLFQREDGTPLSLYRGMSLQVLDEDTDVNASGESAASAEALSRVRGMKDRGEMFAVRTRGGQVRPLIGPEAVDFTPGPNQEFGIQRADGSFQVLSRGERKLYQAAWERQSGSGGTKGAVEFAAKQQGEQLKADAQAIIRAFAAADVSTGVHELSHIARRWLLNREIAPEFRRGISDEDIAITEKWAGAKDGQWDRDAEEKFARGFERFLRDGGPTLPSKIRQVFGKLAEWLGDIYRSVTGSPIDVEISPEMRGVYERLVTRSERLTTESVKAKDDAAERAGLKPEPKKPSGPPRSKREVMPDPMADVEEDDSTPPAFTRGMKVRGFRSEGEVLTVNDATGEVRVKFTSGRMVQEQGARGYFDMAPRDLEAVEEAPTDQPSAVVSALDRLEQDAKDRIKARGTFGGGRLSSGLPLDDLADLAVIGAAKIARGAVKFAEWSASMVKEFGEDIRPHLKTLYDQAKDRLALARKHLDEDDYFNFRRVAISDEEKAALRGLVAETIIRTGRVPKERESWDTIREEAAQLHPKAVEHLAAFQQAQAPFRAVRLAARERINTLNREIVEGRKKLEGVPAEEIIERERVLAQKERDVQGLLDTWMRMRSEDGRNLAMHRMMADAMETWYDASFWMSKAKRELGLPPGVDLPLDIFRALQDILLRGQTAVELGQDAAPIQMELADFITKLRKHTLLETIAIVRKAGLLTGIKTHLRNTGGNLAFQALEELARIPAAIVDVVVQAGTGRRTVHGVSLRAIAHASREAATKGVDEAAQVLKTGRARDSRFEHPRDIYRGLNSGIRWLDAYANFVFRTMSASDRVFKSYAFRRSLEEQAALLAINQGVSPIELLATPTQTMITQAVADAEFATFNNPNVAAEALRYAKGALKRHGEAGQVGAFIIDMTVPFANTPANIIARMLDYTPAGMGKAGLAAAKALANGGMTPEQQRIFSQAIGRGLTGSALLYLGWTLAAAGLASGLGGDDEGDRNVREAAGILSGAVKVGDRWHQIATFSPAGNLVSLGATLQRTSTMPLRQEALRGGKIAAIGTRLALEQPMLKGMADLLDALQRPEARGEMFVTSTMGSFVPTLVNDAASLFDPYRRDARPDNAKDALWTGVVARLPGLRGQLPPRLTVFGDEQAQDVRAVWDPTIGTVARDVSDLVLRELVKHDVGIGWPNRRQGESREDYQGRVRLIGRILHDRLARQVRSTSYRTAPEAKQVELLEDAITEARRVAAKRSRPPVRSRFQLQEMQP